VVKEGLMADLGADPIALDGALCFGWIDGQRKGLDDDSFLQRYSRRRPRSSWSQVNVGKVEALLAAGRMQPPWPRNPAPRTPSVRLGRSERYAVILPVLKARTDRARATVVAREVARLIPRA
jgi:hypothetical protein